MILASEDEVIDRVGLGERVGTQSTFQSALLSATSQLENLIGTSFTRDEIIDYFGCLTNLGTTSVPEFLLNLNDVPYDLDVRLRVYMTNDGTPLVNVTGTNVTEVNRDYVIVNRQTGRVTLNIPTDEFSYAGKRRCIAVRYTRGFETTGDAPYDLANSDQVPGAIKDAAIMLAVRTARASAAPKPKVAALESREELSRTARSLIASYVRPRSRGEFAEVTVVR